MTYNVVAGGVYAEWRDHNKTFSDLALLYGVQFALSASGGQMPETLSGAKSPGTCSGPSASTPSLAAISPPATTRLPPTPPPS